MYLPIKKWQIDSQVSILRYLPHIKLPFIKMESLWEVSRKYHFSILDKNITCYSSAFFLYTGEVCCFLKHISNFFVFEQTNVDIRQFILKHQTSVRGSGQWLQSLCDEVFHFRLNFNISKYYCIDLFWTKLLLTSGICSQK